MSTFDEKELEQIKADSAWWAEAFGEQNVVGFSFRNTARVKLGPREFEVNARDREFWLKPSGIPAIERLRSEVSGWVAAHNNVLDETEVRVAVRPHDVEITLPGEIGQMVNGAEVDEGYTRTVRVEVVAGMMKVQVYGAMVDEPMHIEVPLDGEPREVT